jgi:oligosaccharide translocation protein RFT1
MAGPLSPRNMTESTTVTPSPPKKIDKASATKSTIATPASSEPATTEENASRAAARGTLFTLLLRLVSFLCTQLTVRALDPSTLGRANIQLDLLLTTILFVSREGFRLALTQRVTPDNWTVAWLTIPVVTLVSSCTLFWHLWSLSGDNDGGNADYRLAGTLFCVASWIEGCAEPAVLYFLRRLQVPQRASAEGMATVAKTLTAVLALQSLPRHWHVTAFGLAQLSYAATYAAYLYGTALARPDWPGPPRAALFWRDLDWDTCYVTFIFSLQGLFKHLLTEADKIVLTAMATSYDQGVYAMGASYGGMAARILLQPLEENARLLWSRLATDAAGNDVVAGTGDETLGTKSTTPGPSPLQESYTTLVKLVMYIGLVFSCIAVHYTNLLLNLLAGRTWGKNAEAGDVLAAFCVYTAFLSLNGMTEALVYAVGGNTAADTTTTAEMTKLGMVHTLTGVAFAGCASVLVSRYGTIGLVAANCVAMSIRSLYSLYFAARYFAASAKVSPPEAPHSSSVRTMFFRLIFTISPHPAVLVGFGAAWVATGWSLHTMSQHGYQLQLDLRNKDWILLTGQHIAVGISCVIGIASLAIPLERPFLQSLSGMVRPKREPTGVESSNDRLKRD